MKNFKFLIDTNIFINLEDAKLIDSGFSDFHRTCLQHNIGMYVHEASVDDIRRDKDELRRNISLSKLNKFEKLSGIKLPAITDLQQKFGRISKQNDLADVALLFAVDLGAADFLVTQDQGIHDRVRHTELEKRVLRLSDALSWLRQTFEPTEVKLPLVNEKKAHEIDPADEIFDSLREGYEDFDRWWREKCIRQHRSCWIVELASELSGICVWKDESPADATVRSDATKILKLCTFKVKPKFRGQKLGELLLKQALWFAQRNSYDLVYLTTKNDQSFLIEMLEYFGFKHTLTLEGDELVFEKQLSSRRLLSDSDSDAFELDRISYPRFATNGAVTPYCIPIKGQFHRKLFPEIALLDPLPLFPGNQMFQTGAVGEQTPGNTIRKVYICRAQANRLKPGDVLFFYESKSPSFVASQSMTSVGILEAVNTTNNLSDLIKLTAKRSVFSESELSEILRESSRPVKVIDFLLVGHFVPSIGLGELVKLGIFKGQPPQSILKLDDAAFEMLKQRLSLGFEV